MVIEVTLKDVPGAKGTRFKAGFSAKAVLPGEKTVSTSGYIEKQSGTLLGLFNETSAANPDQLTIPMPPEEPTAPEPEPVAAPAAPKAERKPVSASWDEITKAVVTAARVLGEYGEEQFTQFAELDDACLNGPIQQALRLVSRAVAYELLVRYTPQGIAVLQVRFPVLVGEKTAFKSDADRLAEIQKWDAAKCLAFLLQAAACLEMGLDGPNTDTAHEILDFAELDWAQLVESARRELKGEPSADERLAKLDESAIAMGRSMKALADASKELKEEAAKKPRAKKARVAK